MIFTHEARLTCQEIEAKLEDDAKHFGLMLKKHFPFSQNLPEAGFDINAHASVFELCKPSVAAHLLNTQPELNVLMPCRISVYEKEGKCFVSTPDIKFALQQFECKEVLKKDIYNLYENIMTMIKGW